MLCRCGTTIKEKINRQLSTIVETSPLHFRQRIRIQFFYLIEDIITENSTLGLDEVLEKLADHYAANPLLTEEEIYLRVATILLPKLSMEDVKTAALNRISTSNS